MSKATTIRTDFGEVELTHQLINAVDLIQDAAWTLQLTPAEFISAFNAGIPKCPCCEAEEQINIQPKDANNV